MLNYQRIIVVVALLAACGKPVRFFGDGGMAIDAYVDPPLEPIPVVDADLTDAQICTTLAATGPVFSANVLNGGGPPITGGVIDNGTYRLTKVQQTSGPIVFREVLRLAGAGTTGATFERVTLQTNSSGSWTVDTSATHVTMTTTCGPDPATTGGYNYTPATGVLQIVVFFDPSDASQERVLTYQRQP